MAFGLLSLMRCFELLRKRSLMEQVNSQRQQDELLASVELVASATTDEVLVAAAKLRDHHAFAGL
jgi:hypothetical protein